MVRHTVQHYLKQKQEKTHTCLGLLGSEIKGVRHYDLDSMTLKSVCTVLSFHTWVSGLNSGHQGANNCFVSMESLPYERLIEPRKPMRGPWGPLQTPPTVNSRWRRARPMLYGRSCCRLFGKLQGRMQASWWLSCLWDTCASNWSL